MNKLREYLKSLTVNEQQVFANSCGTTIGYLRKRISDGTAKLGESICIEIEGKSGGAVKCEDLRPDVNWAVIRNTK